MSTDWGMTKVTQAIKSKRDSSQQVSQGQPSQQIKLCTPHFCYSHCGCVYFLSCTVYARCDKAWPTFPTTQSQVAKVLTQHNKGTLGSNQSPPPTMTYYGHVKTISHNGRSFSTSKIQYSCQVLTSQPSKLVLVCKWLWTKGWGIVFCASLHHQQLVG